MRLDFLLSLLYQPSNVVIAEPGGNHQAAGFLPSSRQPVVWLDHHLTMRSWATPSRPSTSITCSAVFRIPHFVLGHHPLSAFQPWNLSPPGPPLVKFMDTWAEQNHCSDSRNEATPRALGASIMIGSDPLRPFDISDGWLSQRKNYSLVRYPKNKSARSFLRFFLPATP